MNTHLVQAGRSARAVFSQFLKQVVNPAISYERLGVLEEKQRIKIEQGLMADVRPVRLLMTSGKGGWHPDPPRAAQYAKSQNVSWLDHSLSVVRGALLFYAIERLQRTPDMDQALLARRLRWIAVIGFLHDFDKLLGLARNQNLPLDELSLRWQHYHIDEFLAEDSAIDLAQVRFLIELVEDTQRQRNLPAQLPSPELKALVPFVALADKLDGIWLSTDPAQGGVNGLLRYLARTDLLQYEPLRHWQAVDIFDPHHPFLLEELQNCLSVSCSSKQLAGIHPLIETHLDGRLFMLLPKDHYHAICEQALKRLRTQLPFDLEINVSNRGVPTLMNGCPDQTAVLELLRDQDNKQLASLFRIKSDLQTTLTADLDQLLAELDLQPRWPKAPGATCSPYANLDRSSLSADALEQLYLAAYLALLLNHRTLKVPCCLPASYDEREQALLQHITLERPQWISTISDQASRLVITALWTSCMAYHDHTLKAALVEENGLLLRWLEGDGELAGLNAYLEGRGNQISTAVEQHLRQLLNQQRVHSGDEHASGRCLFTEQPVNDDWVIDEKLGLYEVKVSAFSGRDGRVESVRIDKPNTLVGPVSVAEYRLRTQRAKQRMGKADGVPTLIYSPSTLGLFAGLLLEGDRQAQELSIYDLINKKPGKLLYHEGAILQHRYYVARYERMPEKLFYQLVSLRLLLKACLRLGRPIHVFRGLAVRETAFFYYDALPSLLSDLIGGNRLRLEQISLALERLELGRFILETSNLGYEVLVRYVNPVSRLGAIALICCQLKSGNHKFNSNQLLSKLEQEFLTMIKKTISNSDGALVHLGQAACMIQRYPGYSASNNEEQLVFDLCLDSVLAARRVGQTDQRSLVLAVAGELRTNLDRKDKVAASKHRAGKSLLDACVEVAELFVTQVWYGALKECPPNQSNRRILTSIYRMAFLLNSKLDSETAEVA